MAVSAFSVLTIIQLIFGMVMLAMGIVDRTAIQVRYSFLMLPIWIGILSGASGFFGILFGRNHRIRGTPNITAIPPLKAVNIICVILSVLAFFLYGEMQAMIGWKRAYDKALKKLPRDKQQDYAIFSVYEATPVDVAPKKTTIQWVLAVIMLFLLAEMFVGLWMALMDTSRMTFGSIVQQNRHLPFNANQSSLPQHVRQPLQMTPQTHYQLQPLSTQQAIQPQHLVVGQAQCLPQQNQPIQFVMQTPYIPQQQQQPQQQGQVISQPQHYPRQEPAQQTVQADTQTQHRPEQQNEIANEQAVTNRNI